MSANFVRWNLSAKRRRRFKQADAIVVSIPKSGRTWLKLFLESYFAAATRELARISQKPGQLRRTSLVTFTHDLYAHITVPGFLEKARGKYLIPPKARQEKPILILARNPRDIIVSLYFQLTKRDHRFSGSLSEMIRHPLFGIHMIIEVMNIWSKEWEDEERCYIVSYESCWNDPESVFKDILEFLNIQEYCPAAFTYSITYTSFENMKALEKSRSFNEKGLTPGDVNDPDSYKVRRGKIGGYKGYLSQEDVDFLDEAIAHLDPRYGY